MSNNKPTKNLTPVKVELGDMTLVFTPAAAQQVAAALIAAGYAASLKEKFVKYVIRHRFQNGELLNPRSGVIYYDTYEEAMKAFEENCLYYQNAQISVTPFLFGITSLGQTEEINTDPFKTEAGHENTY